MNTSTQEQGMLSAMQNAPSQPQETTQQEQSTQQPYNGIVDVDGTPVEVVNGFAEYEGDKFYVSPDGSVVIDQKRTLIGYVQNGKFMPSDEEHQALLQQRGIELE